MQSLSKNDLTDLLRFVEQQIVFTIESTRNVSHYNNFLTSMEATILFNSTCMCLQTIGETIRQIDNRTSGKLLPLYPDTPWKRVIGMRNIISHEYLSIDPEVIFATVKKRLPPLLADIRQILQDIKNGLRDAEIQSLAAK